MTISNPAYIMVEEPSMQALIVGIAEHQNFSPPQVIVLNGKSDLLRRLPDKIKGAAQQDRLMVFVDQDKDDCKALKARIQEIVQKSKFGIASGVATVGEVLIRVVCTELESWYFGDPAAVQAAYPDIQEVRLPSGYSNCDHVNDAKESFKKLLRKYGYVQEAERTTEIARTLAMHLDPERSTSQSFKHFFNVLKTL